MPARIRCGRLWVATGRGALSGHPLDGQPVIRVGHLGRGPQRLTDLVLSPAEAAALEEMLRRLRLRGAMPTNELPDTHPLRNPW